MYDKHLQLRILTITGYSRHEISVNYYAMVKEDEVPVNDDIDPMRGLESP